MAFIDQLQDLGAVAVIRGHSADEALTMAEALLRGGMKGLELTYTTPDCASVVKELRARHGDAAVVGVGSVRSPAQIEAAVEAGAVFAVSPHFEPEVVVAALEADIPYLPGALTPTEVVQCWESGAAAVKIFPASLGGPSYLKAIRAPLPDVPLVPTGGVSVDNMAEWFEAGAVAVGMGGKLVHGSASEIETAAQAVMAELARLRGGGEN